jgi:GxxExxY protein
MVPFRSNDIGHGFLEKVYERPLLVELTKRGLAAQGQIPIGVSYKGEPVGEYVADLLVEGQVIVELKTVDKLDKVHKAQLMNYLKATGTPVGLLVNLKHPKAEIKRIVFTRPEGPGDS